MTPILRQRSVLLVRGFAGLLVATLLAGCAHTPGPIASPIPTLAPGEIALPTFQTVVNGQPAGCGDVGWDPGFAVVHGSPEDPALTWIVFAGQGNRANLLWPEGYRARFTPSLVVLNPFGQVIVREGQSSTGGCQMPPDGWWVAETWPGVLASP